MIWTDHKNLTYIRDTKRLGPRQARWALFFSRFDFTLTYRPGTKNIRADALSRLFPSETPNRSPAQDKILPPAQVVGVITWGIESAVRMAQRTQPDPGGGPRNCLFVPAAVRSKVLQWGHASRLACHPGATQTADFIRRRFWWPTLEADTREFVAACDVCSRSKASHCPASRPPPPSAHPRSTMVGHCPRLCHQPPDLQGQQHHPDRWSTGSLRWSTSSPCRNSRPRLKRRTCSSPM